MTDDVQTPRTVGRYEVLGPLGSGGMGAVFAAYDPELDRKVALKLLHDSRRDGSRNTQARARLLREAQSIAKVSHPNVIHVYEVGVVELRGAERVYVAMELVEGVNLREWLKALHATDAWRQGRAWRKVVEVLKQAAHGLSAAHAAGLMHRDFKPDNILVGNDGLVRVVDFGLARRVRDQGEATEEDPVPASLAGPLDERLTVTGAVLGTPAYMAPEQFRGARTDERTDQFALCLTLYEALYNVRAFQSDTGEGLACAVMMGELREWPSQPPAPAHLVALLRRGLQREPNDRFPSIDAVIEQLEFDPDRGRRRRLTGAGIGLALLGATAAGALLSPTPSAVVNDPCGAGVQRVAEHWNDQRRAQLRQVLEDPDKPYATRTADAVVATFDRYANEWAAAHRDACEATHVRHEQTGELLDRRIACLARRLTSLDAVSSELSRVDAPSLVREALHIASGLPDLQTCADVTSQQTLAPPRDESVAAAVAEAHAQLDRASAKNDVHRFGEARTLMIGLRDAVDATDYKPLLAEYQLLLAHTEMVNDHYDDAMEAAKQALLIAQAASHDVVVRDAAARLTYLIGVRKAQPEQAIIWADLAEATATRVGWTDAKRAELLRSRAWVLVEWGLSNDAIEIGEEAIRAAIAAHGPDGLKTASAHSSLGSVYGRLRMFEKAEVQFRRVNELHSMHLGDDHPDQIGGYLNLGNALSAQRKTEEARAAFDRAIEISERLPEVTPAVRARTYNSLGNLLANEQRWREALVPLRRGLELREQLFGPEHVEVSRTLLSIANALTHTDDVDEATATYERAIAIREKTQGPTHINLAVLLDSLGTHHVRHGAPERAVPPLLRSEAIVANKEMDAYRRADHTYWLGRALFDSEQDLGRGLSLVDDAIAQLAALGDPGLLHDARAWRTKHGGPAKSVAPSQ